MQHEDNLKYTKVERNLINAVSKKWAPKTVLPYIVHQNIFIKILSVLMSAGLRCLEHLFISNYFVEQRTVTLSSFYE